MKYLFKKESVFVTVAIFIVIGIIIYNPLNKYIFDPLKISLTDFSFNDLAFSEAHLKHNMDDRIVILNIDTAGRKSIVKLIENIEAYHPKIVGLDILLPPKQVNGSDELGNVIKNHPDIILCQTIQYNKAQKVYSLSGNEFVNKNNHSGYVNFIGEENGVIRYYPPFLKDDVNNYESFTSLITKYSDLNAYQRLLERDKEVEWINYQRTDSAYYIININDLFANRVDTSFIKGKIVLIGFVSDNPNNIDDKHFTPLNPKVFGRSMPDMNGVIIHANILSMILDDEYITRVPAWIMILFALIITWLHVAFLIKYYIHKHLWFHLASKIVELIIDILILYCSILLLRYINIDADFTLVLISVLIAVDVLYFYEALAIWLAKKFSVNSVFNQTNHRQ